MIDFKAVLLEGVFNDGWPDTSIHPDGSGPPLSLISELTPLVGKHVRLAMHHLPPNLNNLDPTKWGGGSCLWQPAKCPAGHHERPGFLLNVTGEGVLRHDEVSSSWRIEKLDGTTLDLPFSRMTGHYGRLAAATVLDVEKMRDALTPEALAQVEGLGGKVDSLKDILARLGQGQ